MYLASAQSRERAGCRFPRERNRQPARPGAALAAQLQPPWRQVYRCLAAREMVLPTSLVVASIQGFSGTASASEKL